MTNRKSLMMISLLVLALMPVPTVYAEVSDKLPSISEIWIRSIYVSIPIIILPLFGWWYPLLGIPVSLFFVIATVEIVTDPYVGPAIRQEQGWPYMTAVGGAALIMTVVQILAILIGLKKRKKMAT